MPNNYGVEIHGPFSPEYRLTVNGCRVPYITAFKQKQGRWFLVCDERLGLEVSDPELHRFLPFIANCMAVAAGYSSHGKNATPMNPFNVKMITLD